MKKNPKDKGFQSYIDYFYQLHYAEKPVDIITFLKEDEFIGRSTNNLATVYEGWLDVMKEIFRNDSKYLVVLTGAIGIGKTTIADYCLAYVLYRHMNLKSPWGYYEKSPLGKMAVSFFSLTRSLSASKGYRTLMNIISRSPWFINHGARVRNTLETDVDIPLFEWALSSPSSKGFGVQSKDVITAMLDEVDDPMSSLGQKKRVVAAYDATVRRFESRFVFKGSSLGRLFLISSKTDELAFLETFIEEMKSSNKVLVFDKAQWEIFPKKRYSGKRFSVLVGDAYLPSRIIGSEEEKITLVRAGKTLKEIPEELRFDFEKDVVGSLRDYAGISVLGTRRYKLFPSEKFIIECFDKTKPDPVVVNTLLVGLEGDVPWIKSLNLSAIRMPLSIPRCMHLDISFSGDAMALSSAGIKRWTEVQVQTEEGTFKSEILPVIETDFILRIKAREGDRIPLHMMRKFVLDLKSAGMKIQLFTADLRLASEDTMQLLTKAGISSEYFSLDTSITPYMDFRSLVFEKRWICHQHEYLFFELKNLEFNRDEHGGKGKIDHPIKVKDIEILNDGTYRDIVMEGTKDVSDACVGAVINALLLAKKMMRPEDVKKMFEALDTKPAEGLPSDWFINRKSTGGKAVLTDEEEIARKNLEILKNWQP